MSTDCTEILIWGREGGQFSSALIPPGYGVCEIIGFAEVTGHDAMAEECMAECMHSSSSKFISPLTYRVISTFGRITATAILFERGICETKENENDRNPVPPRFRQV